METFGDAYFSFAYGDANAGCRAVEYMRTHAIPSQASLLLYIHLHDDDSALPAFVVLVPHVSARLAIEAAEGPTGVDPVLGHIGTLFERHVSESLYTAIVDKNYSSPAVTAFASDCFGLFTDVSAAYISSIIRCLSTRVLPLMSLMERALFTLLVCCFCVFDDIPSATPSAVEERINTFIAVLEHGSCTPHFLPLVAGGFDAAMHTPFPKWLAHNPSGCATLRYILDDVLGLPRLADLLPR